MVLHVAAFLHNQDLSRHLAKSHLSGPHPLKSSDGSRYRPTGGSCKPVGNNCIVAERTPVGQTPPVVFSTLAPPERRALSLLAAQDACISLRLQFNALLERHERPRCPLWLPRPFLETVSGSSSAKRGSLQADRPANSSGKRSQPLRRSDICRSLKYAAHANRGPRIPRKSS